MLAVYSVETKILPNDVQNAPLNHSKIFSGPHCAPVYSKLG